MPIPASAEALRIGFPVEAAAPPPDSAIISFLACSANSSAFAWFATLSASWAARSVYFIIKIHTKRNKKNKKKRIKKKNSRQRSGWK